MRTTQPSGPSLRAGGLYILYESSANNTQDVDVDILMDHNKVVLNANDGVRINSNGNTPGGTTSIDLGGGALGSTGRNLFYGNNASAGGFFALNNDTTTMINAKSNWWGADADPAALIDAGPGVDYLPWRSVAPEAP